MDYIKNEITVIMTVWKRNNYRLQLDRIKNQTKKPYQIWIYQNESHLDIDISDKEKKEYNISVIHSKDINFKFHARFALPLLSDTEYCAIFDDDTIPNTHWLDHCLTTSKKYNCIVGANGRIIDGSVDKEIGIGDGAEVQSDTKVDFVGHCWFFKTAWCRHFWKNRPYSWKNGEDIHFAASCYISEGIECFVPIMPHSNSLLWGDTNILLGCDEHASFKKNDHTSIRTEIISHWIQEGWKPLYLQ